MKAARRKTALWALVAVAAGLTPACADSRQVNVDMTLFRGSCNNEDCAEVISGTGIIFESDGDHFSNRSGGSRLYAEAVTRDDSTVLLELAYRGTDVWDVRFREIRRGRVAYRGDILRRSFDPTTDFQGRFAGWEFELDTVDDRDTADEAPRIDVRFGQIEILGPPRTEDVARDNGSVEIQGGCGGTIELDPFIPPEDIEEPIEPDPVDPGPINPDEPPPPDEAGPFDDDDSTGCSGDTVEEDSGGGCAGDEPSDDESTGCGGDEYEDEDESTGCGGDEYDEDDDSTGCSGDSSDDDDTSGCSGDSSDDDESDTGCEGDDAAGSIALWRATRGSFRLAWPVGLVAWVNRRMRRRCEDPNDSDVG